jgi:exodeoxyribonuclease V alpha subunit
MTQSTLSAVEQAVQREQMDYSHLALARYLQKRFVQADEADLWLAALVCRQVEQGHICLACDQVEGASAELGFGRLSAHDWQQKLASSCLVGDPLKPGPLVLDKGRIYLARQHFQEVELAHRLLWLAQQDEPVETSDLELLNRLFENAAPDDRQKLSAWISLRKRLMLISGGPGTGKTWTVARILALLVARQPGLRVALAAPTGKAAARLSQSIALASEQLPIDRQVQQAISAKAITLHRLLAMDRFTHRPRYHQDNPLRADLVIVDEASMIDQPMMGLLCDALAAHTRLILLGDRDQLSSVEAGSVFADLCGSATTTCFSQAQTAWVESTLGCALAAAESTDALQDNRVLLTESRRFGRESGIGVLAGEVNRGNADQVLRLMHEARFDDLEWRELDESAIETLLLHAPLEHYLRLTRASSAGAAFDLLHAYQLLCAVWQGPAGVHQVNRLLQHAVRQNLGIPADAVFYHGQPLMISRNVSQYDLSNGDLGVVLRDTEGQLRVWFESADGGYRALALSQLPDHQDAYAITVHKSQGSEYRRVLLVLPGRDSPVCTRELLYTAITRAISRVEIWASGGVIGHAVERPTRRSSGLAERLQRRVNWAASGSDEDDAG